MAIARARRKDCGGLRTQIDTAVAHITVRHRGKPVGVKRGEGVVLVWELGRQHVMRGLRGRSKRITQMKFCIRKFGRRTVQAMPLAAIRFSISRCIRPTRKSSVSVP